MRTGRSRRRLLLAAAAGALMVIGAGIAYAALVGRAVGAAPGGTMGGWRSRDGWGAYAFDTTTRRPVASGGALAWCLDHGHAPPSNARTWAVAPARTAMARTATNGGGTITGLQLAQAGYVISKWGEPLSAPYSTAEEETAAAIMLATYDLVDTPWPTKTGTPLDATRLTAGAFGGWRGYDVSRVITLASQMVTEATANAAVGNPALRQEWTDPIDGVSDGFSWRVRLINGAGDGMAGFPVTVTYAVNRPGSVTFTTPLTGTTDASGYFTVGGNVTDRIRLTLNAAVPDVPKGSALMATDPRFSASNTKKSQRLIMADTTSLSASSNAKASEPDPKVSTSATPGVVDGGDQVTETVTVTDVGGGGDLSLGLYGPFTSAPGAADCGGAMADWWQRRVTSDGDEVFTVTAPINLTGRPTWYTFDAVYRRDSDGYEATHECGMPSETFEVRPTPPTVDTNVTTPLPDRTAREGQSVTETATVAYVGTGGQIDIGLYGPFAGRPDESSCVADARADGASKRVTADGDYDFRFTPTTHIRDRISWFTFVATFDGDNQMSAASPCGESSETFQLRPNPTVATEVKTAQPDRTALEGEAVTEKVAVTGVLEGGEINVGLYGPFESPPGENSCVDSAKEAGDSRRVAADGTYPFTFNPSPGVNDRVVWYTLRAVFNRDDGQTATHLCGETVETFRWKPLPTAATEATTQEGERVAVEGQPVTETVRLTGVLDGGRLDVGMYGLFESAPGEHSCVNTAKAAGESRRVARDGRHLFTFTPMPGVIDRVVWYTFRAVFYRDDGQTASHPCGETVETFRWRPLPRLSTRAVTAEPNRVVFENQSVSDEVAVTGVLEGGGISIGMYGPFEAPPGENSCTDATRVAADSRRVTNDGTYRFTFKPEPGVIDRVQWYTFQATFDRDDGKTAGHACGQRVETYQWRPLPRLTTRAVTGAPNQVVFENQSVSDDVAVTGVLEGGEISIGMYGPFETPPGPHSCVEAARVAADSRRVSKDGTYRFTFTPEPGVIDRVLWYTFQATFDRDDDQSVSHPCGETVETYQWRPLPRLSTRAVTGAPNRVVFENQSVSDDVAVTGVLEGGDISIGMYGPFEAPPGKDSCVEAARVAADSRRVSKDGTYRFTFKPEPGVIDRVQWYTFQATFDRDDGKTASHRCGETVETFQWRPLPRLSTRAATPEPGQVVLEDQSATDAVAVTGVLEGGEISIGMYGPFDAPPGEDSCVEAARVAADSRRVTKDGTYRFTFKPEPDVDDHVVWYTFQATFDRDDGKTAGHRCGETVETFQWRPLPRLSTRAATGEPGQVVFEGGAATDAVTVVGVLEGGKISIGMYGPFDAPPSEDSCVEAARVAADSRRVAEDGTYRFTFTPAPAVTGEAVWYTFRAVFDRDDGQTAGHPCGEMVETFQWRPLPRVETEADSPTGRRVTVGEKITETRRVKWVAPVDGMTAELTTNAYGPFRRPPTARSCVPEALAEAYPVETISADGAYAIEDVTFDEAGWYTFVAAVAREDGAAATHACGLEPETVLVIPEVESYLHAETAAVGETMTETITVRGVGDDTPVRVVINGYGPFEQGAGLACDPENLAETFTFDAVGPGDHSTGVAFNTPGVHTLVGTVTVLDDHGAPTAISGTHPCGLRTETALIGNPAIRTDKTSGLTLIEPGEKVDYLITVENAGDLPLLDVRALDVIPEGIAPGSVAPGGERDGAVVDGAVVWEIGVLGVGESVELTMAGAVEPAHVGVIENTVTVTSATPRVSVASATWRITVQEALPATGLRSGPAKIGLILLLLGAVIVAVRSARQAAGLIVGRGPARRGPGRRRRGLAALARPLIAGPLLAGAASVLVLLGGHQWSFAASDGDPVACAEEAGLWDKADPTLGMSHGSEQAIADRDQARVMRFIADASGPCRALQAAVTAYIGAGWERGHAETSGAGVVVTVAGPANPPTSAPSATTGPTTPAPATTTTNAPTATTATTTTAPTTTTRAPTATAPPTTTAPTTTAITTRTTPGTPEIPTPKTRADAPAARGGPPWARIAARPAATQPETTQPETTQPEATTPPSTLAEGGADEAPASVRVPAAPAPSGASPGPPTTTAAGAAPHDQPQRPRPQEAQPETGSGRGDRSVWGPVALISMIVVASGGMLWRMGRPHAPSSPIGEEPAEDDGDAS